MELIVTRIKILAGLNIAEKRVPQDGGIALDLPGGKVDVRVSMLPTILWRKGLYCVCWVLIRMSIMI